METEDNEIYFDEVRDNGNDDSAEISEEANSEVHIEDNEVSNSQGNEE